MNSRFFHVFLAFLLIGSMLLSTAAFADESSTVASRLPREKEVPMGDEGWTILLYLCGSDLESDGGYATGDIVEILEAAESSQVRVIIQTGGSLEWWNDEVPANKLARYICTGDDIELIETLPDADMGDAETLADFVSWGVKNYGASHMGLVFWNHGGGSIAGVCFDEKTDYNSLSLRDIDTALRAASPRMTDRFEFIGFDACLMATLETANILVPYARYMYASEETEPGTGWDYTTLLNYLAKNPNANGKELGKVQVESYIDYCDGYAPATFSILDLEQLDSFLRAFDQTAEELYESNSLANVARGAMRADNFGGNNRSEGYTNMVDLADLLRNIADYAPSAETALKALEDTVIFCSNGAQHASAGGLAVYYPLSIQGSMELSIFRDICPSTYYLALVDQIAYGNVASGASVGFGSGGGSSSSGSPSVGFGGGGSSGGSSSSGSPSVGFGGGSGSSSGGVSVGFTPSDADTCPLAIEDIYLDENGIYTVSFSDMDDFAYASCTLYYELYLDEDETEWWDVFLGEDDDVIIDYDSYEIYDNFDGYWICLDDNLLPIELVAQYDTESIYTCAVMRNGEETNLRIRYDWEEGEFEVLGTWEGINSITGMAARDTFPLNDGDVLEIIYYYIDEYNEWDYFLGDPITVHGTLNLEYELLPEGDYSYGFNLYDIYGNAWSTDTVLFGVDEDGETYFYD